MSHISALADSLDESARHAAQGRAHNIPAEMLRNAAAKLREQEAEIAKLTERLRQRDAKRFPLLWPHSRAEEDAYRTAGIPRSVPWDFVAEHDVQCGVNHDQTPDALASRGGLSACEMVAVVENRRWRRMPDQDAGARLCELLAAWEQRWK